MENKLGRPTIFTQELADRICARICEGTSVRTICLDDDMPSRETFYRWIRLYPEFRDQYAISKEDSADALFEDMLDIADDGSNDWMEIRDKKGNIQIVLDKEHVMRSRLRVETRKFAAMKLKPKKYGQNPISIQPLGKDGEPTDGFNPAAAAAAVLAAMDKAKVDEQTDSEA